MAIVAPIWGQMGGVLRILDDPALTEEDRPTLEAPVSMAVGLPIREVVETVHLPDMDLHLLVLTATTGLAQVVLPVLPAPLDLLGHTDRQDLAQMGLQTDLQMAPKDKWLIASLYQDRCLDLRHLGPHNLRIPRATPCLAVAPSPRMRSSITMRLIKDDRRLAKEPQILKGDHSRLVDWRAIRVVTTTTTLLQPASGTLWMHTNTKNPSLVLVC
jgi:hypothetical protein